MGLKKNVKQGGTRDRKLVTYKFRRLFLLYYTVFENSLQTAIL